MPENKSIAHLTQNSSLAAAIKGWEMYLTDQGRSPNTIKAISTEGQIVCRENFPV